LQDNHFYLFAREANIGEATRSPTIKAEDKTPSSKLFKLKSPLHKRRKIYRQKLLYLAKSCHIM